MNIALTGNSIPSTVFNSERQKQTQAAAAAEHRRRFEARMPTGKTNAAALAINRKLQYIVNHESYQVTVKVIDRNTDKVIKVLPPEELQRLSSESIEAQGVLFDEKV